MKKAHIELIKKINRDLVLETIRAEQPISRAKVSKKLGISRSTVSSIVDELISNKFVVELGLGNSTKEGGRRAIELGFNPKSGCGMGVDISEAGLVICIADLDGVIMHKEKYAFTDSLHQIQACMLETLHQSGTSIHKVIAIGFCIPGLTNSEQGIVVDSPEMKWKKLHFVNEMKKYFDKPMYINNDVNCFALAEHWLGAAKNMDDFAYISIGAGIGSAIMANGNLVKGKDFMAGEIGYFVLEEDLSQQHVNQLGDFGVFDKKVSIHSLLRYGMPLEELFDRYKRGEQLVKPVLDAYINYLALGIANMVSLLNPEKIIIGGDAGRYLAPVLDEISNKVAAITPISTEIQLSEGGMDSGVLGAIAYAFDKVRNVV